MFELSKRSDIAAFLAMDVLREAGKLERGGANICHMEVGQPGTKAPRLVRERAKEAIDRKHLGYTEALGMPVLRERIARHYDERYGVDVSPEQIVITTGSSAGFILAFLAILNDGDRVGIMRPGYPCYKEILSTLGARPVDLFLNDEVGWTPQIKRIEQLIETKGIKALLLASPANPTGVMMEGVEFSALNRLLEEKGVWFLSDEIYHGLNYDKEDVTQAGQGDHVIVLNSFSKYYSMTGWRIGWMVVPPALVRRMEKLNQHLFISAPTLSQIAAVAAFDALEELEQYKAQYARNREILINGLNDVGLSKFAPPDGAFYVYVDVSDYTDDSFQFSKTLLSERGIAACSGIDFDNVDGQRMMRFSYAGAETEIIEAVRRLSKSKLG